jgi:hypothetical protein
MNFVTSERRNRISHLDESPDRPKLTSFDMSERSRGTGGFNHIVIIDASERSRNFDSSQRRKGISFPKLGKRRNIGQQSFLLLFISFLCGMRLSVDFAFRYSRVLPNKVVSTTDYATFLYETIQSEWNDAHIATSTILQQTINSLQESNTANSIGSLRSKISARTNSSLIYDGNHHFSDYAYAYVIGGCDPDNPSYRGYLYNILASARLLRDQGSVNDVVALFQLSYTYNGRTTLPDADVKSLKGLNIQIYYIPPSPYESFYETVMSKFRILELTQYKRIILMDGDVMPLANLDYLFELSDDNKYGPGNSTLKGNLVVAGPWEPANAGFFMLAPKFGDYEHISQIIEQREERVKLKPNTLFDEIEGWGHIIEPPDKWVSRKQEGSNWSFHFAFSDQGLLYHWTKYVKKEVSIVFFERVENLSEDANGKPYLEREMHRIFKNYSNPLVSLYGACTKFMCDYQHFTGLLKPWLRKPPDDLSEATKLTDGLYIWWYYLKIVNKELSLGLDFDNWVSPGRPTHGFYASWTDMKKKKHFKEEVGGITLLNGRNPAL